MSALQFKLRIPLTPPMPCMTIWDLYIAPRISSYTVTRVVLQLFLVLELLALVLGTIFFSVKILHSLRQAPDCTIPTTSIFSFGLSRKRSWEKFLFCNIDHVKFVPHMEATVDILGNDGNFADRFKIYSKGVFCSPKWATIVFWLTSLSILNLAITASFKDFLLIFTTIKTEIPYFPNQKLLYPLSSFLWLKT